MSDVVELALNTPTADMWDKVLVAFKAALAKAEEAYLKKATSQSTSQLTDRKTRVSAASLNTNPTVRR